MFGCGLERVYKTCALWIAKRITQVQHKMFKIIAILRDFPLRWDDVILRLNVVSKLRFLIGSKTVM